MIEDHHVVGDAGMGRTQLILGIGSISIILHEDLTCTGDERGKYVTYISCAWCYLGGDERRESGFYFRFSTYYELLRE